jgi:hypothetical protein
LIAHLAIALAAGLVPVAPAWAQEAPAESLAEDVPSEEAPTALAQFTTAVEDREPVDQVSFVPNDVRQIFFFSDLRGLKGQTVTHRWIHDGEIQAEVAFEVRGPRWRVWSSKELPPELLGDWTVEIVVGSGEVIAAETFTYTAPES